MDVLKGFLINLIIPVIFSIVMSNKSNYEAELKAAKRAEIERIWFAQEATNKELLEAYKALDVKENKEPN